MRRISYSGILDLDLRWDARDDRYKLLDFNPRLGAQFRLFRDPAGIDVVRAQYLDLTGHPIPHGEQVDGRGFLVENYDPISAFRYWRSHELNLRSWMESLRTVDEGRVVRPGRSSAVRADVPPHGITSRHAPVGAASPERSRGRRAPIRGRPERPPGSGAAG